MSFSKLIRGSVSALAVLAVAGMALAQTVDNKPEIKKEVLDTVTRYLTRNAFVPGIEFNKWPDFLKENQDKVDAANNDEDFQRAVNKALSEFGASHIVLMTPRQTEQRATGATVGIGISSQLQEDGTIVVVRTVKGAPAEQAGLVPGDTIIEVDGHKAEGIRGIPGEENTQVRLKVKKADGTIKDYTLTRKKFSTVRREELEWLTPETAKLDVYTFDFSYDRQNVENLVKRAKKAKNLILDLRDNGGGAVVNLEHLLGLLMNPEQPIGTFISKSLVRDYVTETKGDPKDLEAIANWSDEKIRPRRNRNVSPYSGNLMVFVNGMSGSASEIAAAALQDIAHAKVIGTKSAGAVLVSVIVPASNGFMVQYPLSDYITIRGRRLEGAGVIPDIEAKDPLLRLPGGKDACIEAALGLVAQSSKPGNSGQK